MITDIGSNYMISGNITFTRINKNTEIDMINIIIESTRNNTNIKITHIPMITKNSRITVITMITNLMGEIMQMEIVFSRHKRLSLY